MPAAAKKLPLAVEDIAATTLRGDVRDFLMQWGKNLQKPWAAMSQREQETFRDACDRQAETLVRRATQLVGSQGFESFEISVGDFQKKGTRLEAKIGAPYSRETLIDLAEAGEAGPIVLSLVSMKTFQGERAPAKVMADQPDLMDGIDPDTGEVLDEQPIASAAETAEAAQGGEQQDGATYATERAAAGSEPDDTIAATAQQDALAETATGTTEADDGAAAQVAGPMTDDEWNTLGPEAQKNVDRLAGIQPLDTADAEPVEATEGTPRKRRTKQSMEQRQADEDAAREAHQAGRGQAEQRAE